MRDIRTDLQDRVDFVAQQIGAENARFQSLVSQLKAEQNNKLAHLRAQLRLANKLIDFTVWRDNLRSELTTRISVAEAAENLIKKSFRTANS